MGAEQTTFTAPAERSRIADASVRDLMDGMKAVRWRSAQDFDTAPPTTEMIERIEEALAERGMDRVGEVILTRHRPGQQGLPQSLAAATSGFAVDLTDIGSGADGGVLLFLDETGRGTGWRSEVGALTVWSGSAPVLTELTARAGERVTLFGSAEPKT